MSITIFSDFYVLSKNEEVVSMEAFKAYVKTFWPRATDVQLEYIFRLFDLDFDGVLGPCDFDALVQAESQFNAADTDASGWMTYTKLINYLIKQGVPTPDPVKTQTLFDTVDQNRRKTWSKFDFFCACQGA